MEGPSLTTSSDLGISVSTNRISQPDMLTADRPATPGTQPAASLSQGPKVGITTPRGVGLSAHLWLTGDRPLRYPVR